MNELGYEQYHQKGGTYVIPVEVFDELLEENQYLKQQLEDKENITCNWKDSCLENAGKVEKLENQQKEFIKFLEDNYESTQDIWYIKILQKYKEIIGDVKNEN